VPVAHACNSDYSGGRDLEDCGLKPAQTNSSQDPISKKKKKSQKTAQGERPEFSTSTAKKKKKKSTN
jgi:hypothetical protein